MERLTSWDSGNQEVLINEEEQLLSNQGYVTDLQMRKIKQQLADRLFLYEENKLVNKNHLSQIDFGLRDANGNVIHVGDRTRLILDDGEIREFDVVFETINRNVNTYEDFDPNSVDVAITGIFFKWEDNYLLPCVNDDGTSDVSKMEVVK